MLAELCLTVLLRKLKMLVRIKCITYVDDVNLVASTRESLEAALGILWAFVQNFSLTLSAAKTRLWGSNSRQLKTMAEQWGIETCDKLDALGVEWVLVHGIVPTYSKELLRYKEAEARLKRLSHLGAKLTVKYVAINVGCLSPLDFMPIPLMDRVFALRSHVQKSFALPSLLYLL